MPSAVARRLQDVKPTLDRFGALYATFYEGTRRLLEHMSDDELAAVEAGFGQLTTSNCWFATYGARDEALRELRAVRYARSLGPDRDRRSGRKSVRYFVLRDREVVPTEDHEEWAQMWEKGDDVRRVAKDELRVGEDDVLVSTVFLGLDHNWSGQGPPIVFETMVFGGDRDQEMLRYATWDEADSGHRRIVDELRGQVAPTTVGGTEG